MTALAQRNPGSSGSSGRSVVESITADGRSRTPHRSTPAAPPRPSCAGAEGAGGRAAVAAITTRRGRRARGRSTRGVNAGGVRAVLIARRATLRAPSHRARAGDQADVATGQFAKTAVASAVTASSDVAASSRASRSGNTAASTNRRTSAPSRRRGRPTYSPVPGGCATAIAARTCSRSRVRRGLGDCAACSECRSAVDLAPALAARRASAS